MADALRKYRELPAAAEPAGAGVYHRFGTVLQYGDPERQISPERGLKRNE